MIPSAAKDERWQLYRLLSEPLRLRLLALAAEEELAVGELAELLQESQPNVSRHAAALKQSQLLTARREGTRSWVKLAPRSAEDPVVRDALQAGRALCSEDGSLMRVYELVAARDHASREFFSKPGASLPERALSPALPAYLLALGAALGAPDARALAVDVGTGDGALLDLLSPLFARVVAVDRSASQLARARARVVARGYDNVTFLEDDFGSERLHAHAPTGADLVVSSRVLHHAPRPRELMRELAALVAPGGALLVIDYVAHDDEAMAREQADVWMGFSPAELLDFATAVGFDAPRLLPLPRGHLGIGRDAHVGWQALVARRPAAAPKTKETAKAS